MLGAKKSTLIGHPIHKYKLHYTGWAGVWGKFICTLTCSLSQKGAGGQGRFYLGILMCIHPHICNNNNKGGMNLKKMQKGVYGGFDGRKGREKKTNYIIITKIKGIILKYNQFMRGMYVPWHTHPVQRTIWRNGLFPSTMRVQGVDSGPQIWNQALCLLSYLTSLPTGKLFKDSTNVSSTKEMVLHHTFSLYCVSPFRFFFQLGYLYLSTKTGFDFYN